MQLMPWPYQPLLALILASVVHLLIAAGGGELHLELNLKMGSIGALCRQGDDLAGVD